VNLRTRYLGLDLEHPLMPGASPLSHDIDTIRQLEDAGAAAIVMYSLFEEQIVQEQISAHTATELHAHSFPEATTFFTEPDEFELGPHEYLEHLARVKAAVSIPVIGSLNGATPGGWTEHARLIEQAGADALELNLYSVAADPNEDAATVEERTVALCRAVRSTVTIPVAAKLSPFYTSLPHLVSELEGAGIAGVVMFNRFYQPDIDVDELEVRHSLHLSDSHELLLRLRWLAILSGRVGISLGATGGVHSVLDAVKAVMCGAHGVQMVSALLLQGVLTLRSVRDGLSRWLEEHEYESLSQMQGSMSLLRCPDPSAYERAQYLRVLRTGW
jgi:dihydroorotate dehydrogenase (fumarate)